MNDLALRDDDPNRHIDTYLKYFCDNEDSPRYAVMLKGSWGIGKTHLIKKVLSCLDPVEQPYCYVSLFGVTTAEDLDQAVLRALYPKAFGVPGQIVGHAAKAALKWLKVDSDIKPAEFINRFTVNIFIFDDLERCEMPINRVLGYINSYVEHDLCKVVILGDESKIEPAEFDSYVSRREKLVGRVLEVQSTVGDALPEFIANLADQEARRVISDRQKDIRILYDESGLLNLRILQQTVWDFVRVYNSLDEKHRMNPGGITALIRLFFSLSFEFKAGRLLSEDLKNRESPILRAMRRQRGEEASVFASSQERYTGLDLSDTMLSDEVLVDLLDRGLIDSAPINSCLQQSRHFADANSIPPWRVVWERDFYPDKEGEAAIEKMNDQFRERYFTQTGELLHVFGLRLALSDDKLIKASRPEIVSECKAYVDDLYGTQRIGSPFNNFVLTQTGYGGLGFVGRDTPEFQELFEYLNQTAKKAQADLLPSKALSLLGDMQRDPDLFFRRINESNTGDSTFAHLEILSYIPAKDFVNALLEKEPSDQKTILIGLNSRYDHGRLDSAFPSERPWLLEVKTSLEDMAKAMGPIGKRRIERFVRWFILPVAPHIEGIQEESTDRLSTREPPA